MGRRLPGLVGFEPLCPLLPSVFNYGTIQTFLCVYLFRHRSMVPHGGRDPPPCSSGDFRLRHMGSPDGGRTSPPGDAGIRSGMRGEEAWASLHLPKYIISQYIDNTIPIFLYFVFRMDAGIRTLPQRCFGPFQRPGQGCPRCHRACSFQSA